MKFYNRENELSLLAETKALSKHSAKMTVIVGRRRVGKTSLVKKACEGRPFIYFIVDCFGEDITERHRISS